MGGWSQYRQPGSRTSPSIQRQVRTEVPAGIGSGGVRPVIVPPSAGRSVGRLPGRRGRGSSPARLSSHQTQDRESRERLPGLFVASCAAFWPLPKSHDSYSSPSWQECTMPPCTDTVLLWVTDRGLLGSISAVLNRYWGIA